MLVITRKSQERIRIGKDVEIVVLSVYGQQVKLGIFAPTDKTIRRPETWKSPAGLSMQVR